MKRTIIFSLSLILGLATMMAQEPAKCDQQNKGQCAMLTPEQKAQIITDRMAKAYDLTADQKTKLLDLNTKVLSRRACPKGQKAECPKDKQKCDKGDCNKDGQKCDKAAGHQPMPYVKALSEILTPEQFQAWRTDKMIERSIMPQRHAGPQGHRGFRGHGMKDCQKPCPKDKKQCAKADCKKGCTMCKDCKKGCTKCTDCKKDCSKCKGCKK